MFPKVTKVVSDSKHFLSGNVLVEVFEDRTYRLKNTFCKMTNGGNIDMKKVNWINDNAFEDCWSANITNIEKTVQCDYKAFFNYNGINLLPVIDGAHMMGNIMMTVSNTIPACTTAINRYNLGTPGLYGCVECCNWYNSGINVSLEEWKKISKDVGADDICERIGLAYRRK